MTGTISETKRIALFIPDYQTKERLGFLSYAQKHCNWDFFICPRNTEGFENALDWKPDGCVGYFGREDFAKQAIKFGVPVINIHGGQPFENLPQVGYDPIEAGRMAAEYFLERNSEHFAFIGFENTETTTGHYDGFCKVLSEYNHTSSVFNYSTFYPCQELPETNYLMPFSKNLHSWVSSLPKPVSIFAVNDLRALWIGEACRHLALIIPDEVAILGLGDNELWCHSIAPNVSSIRLPAQNIGHEAAKMLDQLLKGETLHKTVVRFAPEEIIERSSTSVYAIQDEKISRCFKYIHEGACKGIHVDDVAKFVGISRRMLERKFFDATGKTIFKEIRATQFKKVKQLLKSTDMTLEAVAEQTGFSYGVRLSHEFKKAFGITPGNFRKESSCA